MNSRYINYPLHILESVMPVRGRDRLHRDHPGTGEAATQAARVPARRRRFAGLRRLVASRPTSARRPRRSRRRPPTRWLATVRRTCSSPSSTTATRSLSPHARRRRNLPQRRDRPLLREYRHHLQGHLPDQHRRWTALRRAAHRRGEWAAARPKRYARYAAWPVSVRSRGTTSASSTSTVARLRRK